MKLYYYPGACSLAAHIALREAGFACELEKVDLATKVTETGANYKTVNSKGYVPALILDDGQTLTETMAILLYVAARAPEKGLAPEAGTMAYFRHLEWLVFIAAELHKAMGSLFNPAFPEAGKPPVKELTGKRLRWMDKQLAGAKPYLMGETFTVADAYLFTILNWPKLLGIPLDAYAHLLAYRRAVASRPAVQAAMRAEGLSVEAI